MFILLIGSLLIFGCTSRTAQKSAQKPKIQQSQPNQKISTINARIAFKLIKDNKNNSNFIILDVRTPDEYSGWHIEASKLLNFYSNDFKDSLAKLDKNMKYFVYCRSGSRSGRAVQIMEQLKFKQVYNLKGGIIAWKNAELPLKK